MYILFNCMLLSGALNAPLNALL